MCVFVSQSKLQLEFGEFLGRPINMLKKK